MEFLRDTSFRFMRYRKFWTVASVAVVAVAIVAIFVHGQLNIGIDFTGGTQLIVRFQDAPTADDLRDTLAEAGWEDAQIQRFGAEGSDELMIRVPLEEGKEEGSASEVLDTLDAAYGAGPEGTAGGKTDLNLRGTVTVTSLLMEADPLELAAADEEMARAEYETVAESILAARQDEGIFISWDDLAELEAVTPEVLEALRERAYLGSFSLLGEEVVGPTIGAELKRRGIWAVVLSILGMLGYIWVRFELRYGVGAVLAIVHDVLVVLGLFALMDYEFNLSTIAAFLTLVGYSVNDTVVVFDRVRENLRRTRRLSFEETLDLSINQNLSRTMLTSGTTFAAVGALFFLGGEVLRGFSFVLLTGVVVGTYSSIFVASSFTLLWERLSQGEGGGRGRRRVTRSSGDSEEEAPETRTDKAS
ncbi:MAG: protein translocase subunit SecF [Thermoanaerobaculia bacterium]|nr:protein translocase subunit SecF [Thermoanaerobaculia bacterium]